MRRHFVASLVGAFMACLGLGVVGDSEVVLCQGGPAPGCPVLRPSTDPYFPKGMSVKYKIDPGTLGLMTVTTPEHAKALIDAALSELTQELQLNNSRVSFVPWQQGDPLVHFDIFVADRAIVDPNNNHARGVSFPGQSFGTTLVQAVSILDLNNEGTPPASSCPGPNDLPAPCQMFDPNTPNFEESIKNLVKHEALHHIGLGHPTTSLPGRSLMSPSFAPNDCARKNLPGEPCTSMKKQDPEGNLPDCDKSALNSKFPPGEPGGGGVGGGEDPDEGKEGGSADHDWDNDSYDRAPWGFDCEDTYIIAHPGLTPSERCEVFEAFGGAIYDADCNGVPDYQECEVPIYVDLLAAERMPRPGNSNTMSSVANTVLYVNDYIASANGAYRLYYQWDGNLVLYEWPSGTPLWWTGAGYDAGYAAMQTDGHFVVYDANTNPVWWSGTAGNPGAYLVLWNSGILAIHSSTGEVLWTNQGLEPESESASVAAGLLYRHSQPPEPGQLYRPAALLERRAAFI